MEREELIRRILDGELDDIQRRELLGAASAEDPDLLRELQHALEVQEELQRLPVPGPNPFLADRIMAALPRAGYPRSRWRLLLRPVPVPAWALALMVTGVVAGVLVRWAAPPDPGSKGRETARKQGQTPVTGTRAVPVTITTAARCEPAPAPGRRVLFRFQFAAPKARRVSLVADFNGWSAGRTELSDPDGNGIWTVTVPLEPGRYHYRFLVDGHRWVVDPDATTFLADGFGGLNALLDI